jgi:uncharacterized protein YktB (UPF0637 family)
MELENTAQHIKNSTHNYIKNSPHYKIGLFENKMRIQARCGRRPHVNDVLMD